MLFYNRKYDVKCKSEIYKLIYFSCKQFKNIVTIISFNNLITNLPAAIYYNNETLTEIKWFSVLVWTDFNVLLNEWNERIVAM